MLNGFLAKHLQHPADELPECKMLTAHRIILNLGKPFRVEQWYDGCYQQNQMDTGSLSFLSIGVSRRVVWDRSIDFLLLELPPTYIRQMMMGLSDQHEIELISHYKISDPLIHQVGLALKTELQNQDCSGQLYVESMMATLTVQLLKHHMNWKPMTQSSSIRLPKYHLRAVIDYINSNLDRALSLDELAGIVRMNKYYLIRLFKQSTGVTLHQYVTTCRIEEAKRLLAQRMPIVEICHSVGFQSQSHFTHLFHRIVGVSPKVYRDRL